MAVNVKLGVDLSSFNSGIREGQSILKGLNAEMKATEAEFKVTGNAEKALEQKTKTLNSQLNVQKGIIDKAEKALKAMRDEGVEPTDTAYQKMYATLMNATAGMNETQAALNNLTASEQTAAAGANNLTDSVNSIGKKISLDQVISGINSITSGLENAAKKAVSLGEQIWDSIMNSAKWADDTATMAQMYGIDVDTFQRMQKLVTNGMDTSVEAMLRSQKKLRKGIGDGSKEVQETLSELGITVKEWQTVAGQSGSALITKDQTKLFWEAGQAILNMGDAYDKESAAQRLFGRSWEELVPLFQEYKTLEEYNAALDDQKVVSEDSVKNLDELNDKVSELQGNFMTLSTEVIGQLAPALTGAADALNGLLTSVLDYLETPEGKQMLEDLGTAVSGLFDDLGKIDPQSVVEGFTGVFNTVVDSVKWISDNWEGVVTAMEGIVGGWALLKVTGGALQILDLINGLQGLSSGTGVAAATSNLGSILSGAASIALKAAPWLAGLYTLLNPAGTAGNDQDVMTSNGQVTEAGWEFWNNNPDAWLSRLEMVGSHFGDLASILGNEQALQLVADVSLSDEDIIKKLQDEIGLVPISGAVALPENQAALLSQAVGTVEINGVMHMVDENGNNVGVYLEGGEPTDHVRKPGNYVKLPGFANGTWSVPYNGMLARLHKGERVMPAREVASRNFSSNLYVENMNMNGGLSADALAAAIAGRNRRMMAGYGS